MNSVMNKTNLAEKRYSDKLNTKKTTKQNEINRKKL